MTTEQRAKRTKKTARGQDRGHLKVVVTAEVARGRGHVTAADARGQNHPRKKVRRAKRTNGIVLGIDPGTGRMRIVAVRTRKRRSQIRYVIFDRELTLIVMSYGSKKNAHL